jgi:hypothetical protein
LWYVVEYSRDASWKRFPVACEISAIHFPRIDFKE